MSDMNNNDDTTNRFISVDFDDRNSVDKFIHEIEQTELERFNQLNILYHENIEIGEENHPILEDRIRLWSNLDSIAFLARSGMSNLSMLPYLPLILQAFLLRDHPRLNSLQIYFHSIDENAVNVIGDLLTRNVIHGSLLFIQTPVNISGMAGNALQYNTSLKHLHLEGVELCDQIENFGILMIALKSNRSLKHLDLPGCQIGDYELEMLAHLLCDNRTITKLDVNGNKFSKEGIVYFAKRLPQMRALEDLDLGYYSDLDDEGLNELMMGVKANYSLRIFRVNIQWFERCPKIVFYPLLNQAGRRAILQSEDSNYTFPLGLWTKVICRIVQDVAFTREECFQYAYYYSLTNVDILSHMLQELAPFLGH